MGKTLTYFLMLAGVISLASCQVTREAREFAEVGIDFAFQKRHACSKVSPPFKISNVPAGTGHLRFRMKDLDNSSVNHGGGDVKYTGLKDWLSGGRIKEGALKLYDGPCPSDVVIGMDKNLQKVRANTVSSVHRYEIEVEALNKEKTLVLGRGRATKEYSEFHLEAQKGNPMAQNALGKLYSIGKDGFQDYKLALEWFKIAAKQGNTDAMVNLGLLYEEGRGVPQNYKTALKYFKQSASLGSVSSQWNVGRMYFHGRGVTQNFIYAHMWWNIAATIEEDALSKKFRGIVQDMMSPAEIEEAQALAQECVRNKFKGCGDEKKI